MRRHVQISFLIPVIVFLVAVISIPGSVRADDFYVDAVYGDDETGDGSETNPWRKLQFAIDTIHGTVENPHTIHLAPGFYGPKGSGDEKDIYFESYEDIIADSLYSAKLKVLNGFSCQNVSVTGLKTIISCAYGCLNVVFDRCILMNSTYSAAFSNCDISIINSVFYESKYALVCSGGTITVIDCIFQGNLNIYRLDGSGVVDIRYSCLDEEIPGEGNIIADPLFSDPDHGDFRIGYGSPCIDAGDPDSPVPPGGGDRIDMGCWEYLEEPQLLSINVETVEITGDGDGIPEMGEILESRVALMNTGEPAQTVTAVLSCSHPDVTLISGGITYPDIPTWETAVPSGDGFRWQVTSESGWCVPADFTLTWMASGSEGTLPLMFNLHGDGPHVNPVSGSDEIGTGSPVLQYRTLTHAFAAVRGGRWSPVTVYAHAGTYSPSTNSEIYPIWFGDWESIRGDGWVDATYLHNTNELEDTIFTGFHSNIRDIHVRSESDSMRAIILSYFSDSIVENCYFEREEGGALHQQWTIAVQGSGTFTMRNCMIHGSASNTGDFKNDILLENNDISGFYNLCSGRFINNHVGDLSQAHYSYINDPMIVSGNVLESGGGDTTPGQYEFTDNIIIFGSRGFGGEGNNKIVGNVCLDGSFGLHGTGFTTSHNISMSRDYFMAGYAGSGVYIDNSIAASLKPSLQQYGFYMTYGGAFSLDNCIGVFGATGVFWAGAAWSNHGIYYHNRWGEGECHDAWYNDLEDCPAETNMDLDPEFVGTGIITALGPGFLEDSTAAWEPDRYAGYYVNPDAPNQDTQFYITGNDADTLYVMGNPGVAASVGDRFFFPDFHLRRIADGYAWDSPLIDAGNPDPAYNDPDGSRCDLGPYGGPLATTPMPEIPTWPPPDTPTVTPTPTITPTGTATPSSTPEEIPSMTPTVTATAEPTGTPVCDITGVTIVMPLEIYYPGDTCYVTVTVCNTTGSPLVNYPLFVVLDVYGTFFFGPGFTGAFDSYLKDYPVFPRDATVVPVLDPFTWPDTGTSAAGILFHAALTDPEVSVLFGEMDTFEFGWGQ